MLLFILRTFESCMSNIFVFNLSYRLDTGFQVYRISFFIWTDQGRSKPYSFASIYQLVLVRVYLRPTPSKHGTWSLCYICTRMIDLSLTAGYLVVPRDRTENSLNNCNRVNQLWTVQDDQTYHQHESWACASFCSYPSFSTLSGINKNRISTGNSRRFWSLTAVVEFRL